jgi:hypothetical protein
VTSRTATRRRRELERRPVGAEPVSFTGRPLAVEEQAARELAAVLGHPDASSQAGIGWTAYHRARRVDVPARLRRGVVVGAGQPLACYELAAGYVLAHASEPVILVHGVVVEDGGVATWHAWVELPDDALWDPTTGRFFSSSSFHQVLSAVAYCEHPPVEVALRTGATGEPGPWPDCKRRADKLAWLWLERLAATHPDLAAWIAGMRDQDPSFAAFWEQLVADNDLFVIHVLSWLIRRPDLWQDHQPGTPWPELARLHSWLTVWSVS